jgi:hypothetical protein
MYNTLTDFTKLSVIYESVFEKPAENLHDASADVQLLVEIIQKLSESVESENEAA